MRVTFTIITYICLCFIKVIVLAPSSVLLLLHPHIYVRVLSCICVFLESKALREGVQELYNTMFFKTHLKTSSTYLMGTAKELYYIFLKKGHLKPLSLMR